MKIKPIGQNQTEVELGKNAVVFHSYETPVAACIDGQYFRTAKKHSLTTSRHINKWLQGAMADTMPQSWFDHMNDQTVDDFRVQQASGKQT